MPISIGIDVGTTHIKACAVLDTGEMAAFSQADQEMAEIKGFGLGMDCTKLWTNAARCLKQVLAKVEPEEVTAIGIASMAEAGALIDAQGRPLGPVLSWNSPPKERKLPDALSGYRLYQKTGLVYHTKYSLSRILWYAEEKPDIYQNMRCFLSVADYIAFCLSGEYFTEESLACRTMLYNLKERRWDKDLVELAGMEGRLPRVLGDGDELPFIEKKWAEYFGVGNTVRIGVSGHDHLCGALAQGLKSGEILNSIGTSEVFAGFLEKTDLSEDFYRLGILQGRFDGKPYFICNMPSCGASVEWLLDFLSVEKRLKYEDLPGLNGQKPSPVCYLPFINGSGSHRGKGLRGGFLGITQNTGREDILQAVYEGIACEDRVIFSVLERAGILAEDVIAAGGGTKNSRLMQAKADVTGKTFRLSDNPQATAVGAALKAGGFRPQKPGCKKGFRPDKRLEAAYEEKMKTYEGLMKLL